MPVERESLTLVNNYIYIYNLPGDTTGEGTWLFLPTWPDTVTDSLQSNFASQNALSRTAPVQSYINSGPRTVQFNLNLHRDMVNDLNMGRSNLKIEIGDDYVDTIIKCLQSIVLPRYNAANKEVEPPMVAVRFGDEIFVKGVVSGNIGLQYSKPILDNGKYAQVSLSLVVTEVEPIDAETVAQWGSFRYLTKTFKNGIVNIEE